VPYLVLVLSFLFANALGIDILKIVQQFIRIYSVLIFIYMTGLCARRLYFQVKKPFTSLKMILVSSINYVIICLLLISLRVQKLLGLRGGRHKFNYGSGQRT